MRNLARFCFIDKTRRLLHYSVCGERPVFDKPLDLIEQCRSLARKRSEIALPKLIVKSFKAGRIIVCGAIRWQIYGVFDWHNITLGFPSRPFCLAVRVNVTGATLPIGNSHHRIYVSKRRGLDKALGKCVLHDLTDCRPPTMFVQFRIDSNDNILEACLRKTSCKRLERLHEDVCRMVQNFLRMNYRNRVRNNCSDN